MNSPWIQTFSGLKFHLFKPEMNEYRIEDIAHSLSNICRFGGHTKRHLSVAEHSYHVSLLCPEGMELAGLLHDAAEAFYGDIPSPLKDNIPDLKFLERTCQRIIFEKFCGISDKPPYVLQADRLMLNIEARDLLGPALDGWYGEVESGNLGLIKTWVPEEAERMFLNRFRELRKL
jgi:hypothetical protein